LLPLLHLLSGTPATAALFSSSELSATTNVLLKGDVPDGLKSLEVDNRLGAIRIVGTDGGPLEWSWNLKVRARNNTLAQQAASKAACTAERVGDRLRLTVSLPNSDGKFSLQSDLEIRVPKAASVVTKNAYGPTSLSDLSAAEASSQSGSVDLQSIPGKVHAHTSFASLRVRNVGPAILKNQSGQIQASDVHGTLQAETSFATLHARDISGTAKLRNQSGSIEAVQMGGDADIKTSFAEVIVKTLKGDLIAYNQSGRIGASDVSGSVEATTSFGALDIEGRGPSFECRNQSGSIHVRATSSALTNLVAHTSFGAMEIRLASTLNPVITAHTSYGSLKSDFPLRPKAEPKAQKTQTISNGTLGAPRIHLENQSGSIRVLRDPDGTKKGKAEPAKLESRRVNR
jgi:DUF4097 and DUF4098 domain-containing protein YvlB